MDLAEGPLSDLVTPFAVRLAHVARVANHRHPQLALATAMDFVEYHVQNDRQFWAGEHPSIRIVASWLIIQIR